MFTCGIDIWTHLKQQNIINFTNNYLTHWPLGKCGSNLKLEQLECLLSEDTPQDYPYYWVILYPKSKEDKVKVTNLKNGPKCQIFNFLTNFTHLLKLLDNMCKYEMDPTSIVEDTEQTRFCPQMDRRPDGQMDRRRRWNQYTLFELRWSVCVWYNY